MPWRGDAIEGFAAPPPMTAYGTWVSEIMLQQTRVETVIAYWHRWMDRFPTLNHLAAASPEEVNSCWAGLGYYRRAQNLLKGAKHVIEKYGGKIPETVAELLTIPGVGPYTAGAIASVAYGRVECVVDGNVIRVLSRLRAMRQEGRVLEKQCWQAAAQLVDPIDPGNFNQAIMEHGAVVCKPQNPVCLEDAGLCSLSDICMARRLSEAGAGVSDNGICCCSSLVKPYLMLL